MELTEGPKPERNMNEKRIVKNPACICLVLCSSFPVAICFFLSFRIKPFELGLHKMSFINKVLTDLPISSFVKWRYLCAFS